MRGLHKEIYHLAVPSILANITIPLVGLVDTAIVGHLSDAATIGGIAVGTMLFDLLYWNFGFLRTGTSGLTAQANGMGKSVVPMLCRSLRTAWIAAGVMIALQWLFVEAALAVVPCSAEVASFAREYFYVRIWAAPATLSLMAIKGWLIGLMDTVSPMWVDMVVNGTNMLLSYGLATGTSLGALGVAWGTLGAQYTGLILAVTLVVCRHRQKWVGQKWRTDSPNAFRLNANLFVRSLCMLGVYVGWTMLASREGDVYLAISGIMMKLFLFYSFFVDGFAYAGEAMVGNRVGEIRTLVRALMQNSLLVALVFTLIYMLLGMDMVEWITTDTSVRTGVAPYLPWLVAMPIVSTLAFMWDGIFTGLCRGETLRNAMICAVLGFAGCYLPTHMLGTLHALYIAYFAHLIGRVLYLTYIYWHDYIKQ